MWAYMVTTPRWCAIVTKLSEAVVPAHEDDTPGERGADRRAFSGRDVDAFVEPVPPRPERTRDRPVERPTQPNGAVRGRPAERTPRRRPGPPVRTHPGPLLKADDCALDTRAEDAVEGRRRKAVPGEFEEARRRPSRTRRGQACGFRSNGGQSARVRASSYGRRLHRGSVRRVVGIASPQPVSPDRPRRRSSRDTRLSHSGLSEAQQCVRSRSPRWTRYSERDGDDGDECHPPDRHACLFDGAWAFPRSSSLFRLGPSSIEACGCWS